MTLAIAEARPATAPVETETTVGNYLVSNLADRMKEILSWDAAEEVTFECEPGTLTDHKLKVIREVGVTRLSLGVENFGDPVLDHPRSAQYGRARKGDFLSVTPR